ncbi:hypothetical protein BH11MYX4_BH11MYX4_65660 [soil metagenome]
MIARDDLRIASDLRFAIDRTFRAQGIAIPFPQRDVHVVSGAFPAETTGAERA